MGDDQAGAGARDRFVVAPAELFDDADGGIGLEIVWAYAGRLIGRAFHSEYETRKPGQKILARPNILVSL